MTPKFNFKTLKAIHWLPELASQVHSTQYTVDHKNGITNSFLYTMMTRVKKSLVYFTHLLRQRIVCQNKM